MPALPPEINRYIETDAQFTLFDVGGDGAGARVLSRYSPKIILRDYDMYIVINANRPATSNEEGVLSYIKDIEFQSRLKINGIVNNTHMLRETTEEDIVKGAGLCGKISRLTGLPIVFNVVSKCLKIQNICSKIDKVFFLEELYMRPDWL
jgi:hypothetical protein